MLFRKKSKDAATAAQLASFHGKRLSAVVERTPQGELVLGKQGGISISATEIVIVCDGHEVFRGKKRGCIAAQLMSGNGCDIKAEDSDTGQRRHIIAHYAKFL